MLHNSPVGDLLYSCLIYTATVLPARLLICLWVVQAAYLQLGGQGFPLSWHRRVPRGICAYRLSEFCPHLLGWSIYIIYVRHR